MGQNHRLVVYEWRMHSPVWLCACLCVKQRYGLLSPVRARVYMTLWKHSCVCVYAGVCERVNEWVKEKEHTMLVWAGVSPHGLIRHSRQLKNPAYVCVSEWLAVQPAPSTHAYIGTVPQIHFACRPSAELSTCVPACVYACWEAKLKGFSREITHIWAQILSKAAVVMLCGVWLQCVRLFDSMERVDPERNILYIESKRRICVCVCRLPRNILSSLICVVCSCIFVGRRTPVMVLGSLKHHSFAVACVRD